ncbi:hypothetical protein H0X06_07170, partial [Candidatus Dependentiae bacterium]|nr:hypothetical protein [Candidatus Dependentiae bacterium]
MKRFIVPFIFLIGFVSGLHAENNDCTVSTPSPNQSVSDDCGECPQRIICSPRTYLRPRSITTDLTYRNAMTFYQRYHGARDAKITYDSSLIFQKSRNGRTIGAGYLGKNPLVVAENNGDISSLNLGLISSQPEGFRSQIKLSAKRKVFAWLTQFIFNLDPLLDGLWADVGFAMVKARHIIRLDEKVTTPGDVPGLQTVNDAFTQLGVFPTERRSTAVDDVEIRVGYDYSHCGINHAGIYFLGSQSTGPRYDNTMFFQPLVGSRHSGIGGGFRGVYSCWEDLTFLTEIKYQYKFRKAGPRIFDLCNG